MKVLLQSRIDLFSRRGGDTVQMEKTAGELEKLGVDVEISCEAKPDLSNFDLVHLFNIDWPAQVYLQAKNAEEYGVPIVFSPIHHSFQEIERYEKENRYGLRRIINFLFPNRELREKFKDVCRMVADPKKIPSTLVELRKGIWNQQRELLQLSDLVLVQTKKEAKDLETDFSYQDANVKRLPLNNADFYWRTVVNGVDPKFAAAKKDSFVQEYGLEDFVLCVGRIEPRKNQLAVVGAVTEYKLQNPNVKLVFVGKISQRHPEYAFRFKRKVKECDWIYHIQQIPYEKIGSCYAAAKVHVLASWFETTGLVNLEAALAGASVVAVGERAREYLENCAFYCDPGDIPSITEAIKKAWAAAPDPSFSKKIKKNFTWERAAKQTLEVYQMVVSSK
ncbi:MAG: glycosyltransferase [Patescibacteria group bacterium]